MCEALASVIRTAKHQRVGRKAGEGGLLLPTSVFVTLWSISSPTFKTEDYLTLPEATASQSTQSFPSTGAIWRPSHQLWWHSSYSRQDIHTVSQPLPCRVKLLYSSQNYTSRPGELDLPGGLLNGDSRRKQGGPLPYNIHHLSSHHSIITIAKNLQSHKAAHCLPAISPKNSWLHFFIPKYWSAKKNWQTDIINWICKLLNKNQQLLKFHHPEAVLTSRTIPSLFFLQACVFVWVIPLYIMRFFFVFIFRLIGKDISNFLHLIMF